MPIDINLLRTDRGGDPDKIRESQRRRFKSVELVDEIIALDAEWRGFTSRIDDLRQLRNQIQQQITDLKKAKQEVPELLYTSKTQHESEIEAVEAMQLEKAKIISIRLSTIGNIVEDAVPVSQDEDKDNLVVAKVGPTPTGPQYLHHHEVLTKIGAYEAERGVGVAGHRGYFLKGYGVMLNQALINYGIAFLNRRGYTALQPPFFMNKDVMAGVAQLEQFDEELYKVVGDDEKYLIATSEQPICAFHKGEWMREAELPKRYAGISTCFRKEAGAHGKDTWGIFRVHQFEKVEQFCIVDGDLAVSQAMQEEMIHIAEEFYQSLGFSYHVVSIVSGSLNNAAIKKYDLEAWFPGYNTYRELVSCSNCTDYQSRAMEIRCGTKRDGAKRFVHMLNATLCATERTMCCLAENYQTSDGLRVPEVLVPFMGGITFIPYLPEAASGADAKPTATSHAVVAKAVAKADVKPVDVPVATAAGAGAGDAQSILAVRIVSKGNEIRDLKSKGGSKEDVKVHVDELNSLKAEFKALTGEDYGGKPAKKDEKKPAKQDKKNNDDDSKTDAKPAKSEAKAAKPEAKSESKAQVKPVQLQQKQELPPQSVSAAGVTASEADLLNVDQLNHLLEQQSFVGGAGPSLADLTQASGLCLPGRGLCRKGLNSAIFCWLMRHGDVLASHIHVTRWLNALQSFSQAEQEHWH